MVQEDLFFEGISYGQDRLECAVLFGDLNEDVMGPVGDDDQDEELLEFLKNLV